LSVRLEQQGFKTDVLFIPLLLHSQTVADFPPCCSSLKLLPISLLLKLFFTRNADFYKIMPLRIKLISIMFDFEKLEVYKKAKQFNIAVSDFLRQNKIDRVTHDQLRRAAFSVMLNIAEGTGRLTKPDKRNFMLLPEVQHSSVLLCLITSGT